MKVLLVCAGYGTRLARDLETKAAEYPHLVGVPKPLMPIGGSPLISRWVQQLEKCNHKIAEVAVVVNDLHFAQYDEWLKKEQESSNLDIKLVNDGTRSNEDRLGAVACIQVALEKCLGFEDHVLVIAGDTLFDDSFDLNSFFESFESIDPAGSLLVDTTCLEEEVSKRGILEVEEATGRVKSFLEKPKPEETTSRKQSPCFYLLHSDHLKLIEKFLDSKKDLPLAARDATGNLIRYLVEETEVYSTSVNRRFDIGSLQAYLDCDQQFKKD